MSLTVRLSPHAQWDLTRLANYLAERDQGAAERMQGALNQALASLATFPARAPLVDDGAGIRELRVRFGRYGYGVHYRVDVHEVLVTHVFHVREGDRAQGA